MDEINEKAIKEIIDYYDSLNEVHETEEKTATQEEEAPALVDIIQEAHSRKEKKEAAAAETEAEVETETNSEAETAEEVNAFDTEEAEDDFEEAENEAKTEEAPEESSEKSDNEADKEELSVTETAITISPDEEDEEKEKKRNKKSKRRIITGTLILMVIVVLLVTVDTGFIGAYKRNVSKNVTIILNFFGIDVHKSDTRVNSNSKNTQKYKTSVKNTVTVPMEMAGQSEFIGFKGNIVSAHTNYMSLIGSDGSTIWENTTTIVNPILKTAGNYLLLAEKGGRKICLYNDSKLIYEIDTEDNILNCSVSSNGDVIAVTDKASYKGAAVVFNREGKQIFAWSSGSDNIISADISPTSRRVAVSLLNTDDKVRSTVQLFNINEEKSYAQVIFEDTIIFDTKFNGDTLSVFGDNCIAGIYAQGELIYDKRFDDVEFVHYGTDEEGNKILLFDNTNIPLINIYNRNAALKYQLSPEELPDFVDIWGKYIVYNSGRNIIYGRAGKSRLEKYTASMDIKELMLIDDNTLVIVYSNNIEIVKV